MTPAERGPRRDEAGQVTLLLIGFATVIVLTVAVVVDATAAYLQRQGLDTLADGAALRGADLAPRERPIYVEGVPRERLELTAADAHAAVAAYLRETGAYRRYPGLRVDVDVDQTDRTVTVRLSAPVDLPLNVPGSPDHPSVGATGSAVVAPDPSLGEVG